MSELTDTQRKRLFAIIAPSYSGKSTFADEYSLKLQSNEDKKKWQFIDINDLAKLIQGIEKCKDQPSLKEFAIFNLLKAKLIEILDKNTDISICVLTENITFVKNFLKIKEKRCYAFMPTKSLCLQQFNDLTKDEKTTDTTKRCTEDTLKLLDVLMGSRENLLRNYKEEISTYDKYSEMVDLVKKNFKLTAV